MDAYSLSKTWSVTMKSAVGLFTVTARNSQKFVARRLSTPRKNRKQKLNSRTREFTRSHWTFFCTSTEGPGTYPTPNFSAPLVEPSGHEWFRRATKNRLEGKTKTDEERERESFDLKHWICGICGCVVLLMCRNILGVRLRVVRLLLSPSSETISKLRGEKWPREIGHFLTRGALSRRHDGLSERGDTRCLVRFWRALIPARSLFVAFRLYEFSVD